MILFLLLGVAGYFFYNSESVEEDQPEDTSSAVKHYVSDEEHPLNFCGEPVPLDSIAVRKKIDREIAILTKYRSSTLKLFQRGLKWFPRITEVLKKHRVPEDFKYIAMIESNLTNVVSPRGATGFWQFMRRTGRNMGLEINNEVDERFSPLYATRAAAKYFNYAKGELGTWTNTAASYNLGIAGLQKRIKRQGQDSYYFLRLNKETTRYLYKAIAFKEVYENREKYGFKEKIVPEPDEEVEVYEIEENIPNLIQLAESEGITYTALLKFNPWLRGNTLTLKSSSKKYFIKIPVNKIPYAVKRPTSELPGVDWDEVE